MLLAFSRKAALHVNSNENSPEFVMEVHRAMGYTRGKWLS